MIGRAAIRVVVALAGWLSNSTYIMSNESGLNRGHLVIIGGGLRADNRAVFEEIIQLAGGADKANIVILPTASYSTSDSNLFAKEIAVYGVPSERIRVLDVTEHNSSLSTRDPAILDKVKQASCVFLSGGDQRRLVRALTQPDGSDTPLLGEIRNLLKRGGVIAGSSAGASAQSATMLAVSGLPDMLIDEGFDTLDFGIRQNQRQRGLLITRGFGFFDAGVIDQHFYHFRGRLSRLIRAVDDCKLRFGFGIEENTALIVQPDGRCRVQGAGLVTIIKTPQPGVDGPLGYSIENVWLSAISRGDTFDPATESITIDAAKPRHLPEKAEYNGNFLLSDIGTGRSAQFALIAGLTENQKTYQDAIMLKYQYDWSHGYRFRLRKTESTQAYAGVMNGEWTYSLLNIRVDIAPIAQGLGPSGTHQPADLPADAQLAKGQSALAYRGIMTLDSGHKFRANAAMLRGELASAMARSAHLHAASLEQTIIKDVESMTMQGDEIYRAVAAGFIGIDDEKRFRPDQPATCDQAVHALRRLALKDREAIDEKLLKRLEDVESRGTREIQRGEFAQLLFEILDFRF